MREVAGVRVCVTTSREAKRQLRREYFCRFQMYEGEAGTCEARDADGWSAHAVAVVGEGIGSEQDGSR